LFTYQEEGYIWIYPFILQPINKELSIKGCLWFDIESAYGYGGPLSNTENKSFISNANKSFSKWCKKNNVVAEFIRFNPLLKNYSWVDKKIEIEYDRDTISQNLENLDVDNPPFNGKVRNMIKSVSKHNVKIDVYDPIESFNYFEKLYCSTMLRVDADNYYYFNKSYFSNLCKFVAENGWLVGATLDGEWVGSALFLKGKKSLHYHLSATNSDFRIPGVTNALIFKGMQLGASRGLDVLHLGGGRSNSANDSLLKFKQKMGNMSNEFFIGKRVHNSDFYAHLKNNWGLRNPKLKDKYNRRILCYRYTM